MSIVEDSEPSGVVAEEEDNGLVLYDVQIIRAWLYAESYISLEDAR